MKRPVVCNAQVVSLSAKLRTCVLSESGEKDGKVVAEKTGPTDRNIYVICTFNKGKDRPQVDQNGHILHAGMCVVPCHFD